jgi:hypothetical protein
MPQWLRANLLLLGLIAISAALLYLSHVLARALGLLPEEQRYFTAAIGVLVIVVNYFVARRMHRALTRISLDKR